MRRRLRDYLPKGLYWRTYLIIVLPVAAMQILVASVFVDAHWRATSKRMTSAVAGEIAAMVQLYESAPEQLPRWRALANGAMRLQVAFEPGAALPAKRCLPFRSVVDTYLQAFLSEALSREVWYDASCPGPTARVRTATAGGVLEFRPYKSQIEAGSIIPFLIWTLAATAALSTVSLLFIRNQIKPVQLLANAMDRFGQGLPIGDFRPRGASEVRQAAGSFLAMRERIMRHLEQRSLLLAGVSHDLRTPLTRLRLQLAMMQENEEREAALQDLQDLETTLEEYLAFARGDSGETPEALDLAALARDVAESLRSKAGVLVTQVDLPLPLHGRRAALRRCLGNLIDNAAAHGERVQIRAWQDQETYRVDVEDNGPGLPPASYEEAFRPFSRLDATRSRNTKGVGLGLAIARDVARAHGGDILLSKSEDLGGLRASLILPALSPLGAEPEPLA